jgi:hypothetical protein
MTISKYAKVSEDALTVVKTTELFVTEFVGNTSDPTMTKGLMESAPNLYKNGVTFFLDYSNTSNPSDLKLLKRFFSKLGTGNTFAVSGGNYYDELTQSKYSFEGVYKLSGYTGTYNNFLNITGISYSGNLIDGTYKNYNFNTVLNFSSSKGVTAQYFVSKFNNDTPYNLEFFGIYGEDFNSEEYLEVLNTKANTDRYLINSFVKLNNGQEIVVLDPAYSIINENMYFQKKTINLLMRGVPDLNTLSQSKFQNGVVKKINSEQETLDIFVDQNLHQRYSRAKTDSTNYYDWYATRETDNFKAVLNPYSYDKLSVSVDYYSYAKIGYRNELTIEDINAAIVPQTIQVLSLYIDNVVTSTKIYDTNLTATMPNIKIDLSDSSLVGWRILPFYDEDCSIPLDDYYYLNGVPGFDGCSFIFLRNQNAPSAFYLKFEKDNVLKLLITV